MDKDYRVVYILAPTRSGSTLLDYLLGIHEDTISVGELASLEDFYYANRMIGRVHDWRCSCGMRIVECPFWSRVLGRVFYEKGSREIETRVPTTSRPMMDVVIQMLKKLHLKRDVRLSVHTSPAVADCHAIYEAINQLYRPKWIVDSSKGPDQLYQLRESQPEVFKVIYLRRDCRAVALSHYIWAIKFNLLRKSLFRLMLSTCSGYMRIQRVLADFNDEDVLAVDYKNLAENTQAVMENVYQFLGLSQCVVPKNMHLNNTHNIGGTPRRNIDRPIHYDARWKERIDGFSAAGILGIICNMLADIPNE